MKKYIDVNYYKLNYKGSIEGFNLNNLIIEASRYIQKHTLDRADSDIEEVKYCCCVLVDKLNEYEELKEKNKKHNNKKAESVGKWSITYGDVKNNIELEKELNEEILNIIKLYLSDVTDKNGVNLLYRGDA